MKFVWYVVPLVMLATVVPGLNVTPTAQAGGLGVCDVSPKFPSGCDPCTEICETQCVAPGLDFESCYVERAPGEAISEALADPDCGTLYAGYTIALAGVEVEVCITAPFDWIIVMRPGQTIPPDVRITGYVDRYSFLSGSLFVPCIVVAEPESLNPCATAGGVFVNRVLTIIDTGAGVPPPVSTNLPVCHYKVTALALGFGLNQFPFDAPCG